MPDLSAHQTIRATYDPIHDIGSTIYLSPETRARAGEWGWANPFAFYFAGRCAVMGDVHRDLAVAAMGWFNPDLAGPIFDEGVAVHGAQVAAERMVEAQALRGRDHLAGLDLGAFVAAADRLVDGADGAGLPLFTGWRSRPRVDDEPGRAAQLFQTLREWRGSNHLVATTAAGLTPQAGPG